MKFISAKVHTVIGLIVGVILLFAPQLFDFADNQMATYVTIGTGVFIILSEMMTTSRLSIIKLIPMRVHLMLDYFTGVFILLSPWIFGFSEEVTIPHIVVGILVVGYALLTDPEAESTKSITE